MRLRWAVLAAVLAVVRVGTAMADEGVDQAEAVVTNLACSADVADEWNGLSMDGKFVARGDAKGRAYFYPTPADAAADKNPRRDYLVVGDFVRQPAPDSGDWGALYSAALTLWEARHSSPIYQTLYGLYYGGDEPDPDKQGQAVCVRYERVGHRPVIGWIRAEVLGSLPDRFVAMSAADQAALEALPAAHWPNHISEDGDDDEEIWFYHGSAARDAASGRDGLVVDDRRRWVTDGEDDCWSTVYLLNNAIFVTSTQGEDCWGDHGQDDPGGVYAR